jgi:hypothetical protein
VLDYLQGIEAAEVESAVGDAVQMPTGDHAYTQYALARLRDSQARNAEAATARAAAIASPEPSWIVYNAEIDARVSAGDFVGADMVMADAVARFDESPVLLPKRVLIQGRLGNDAEVQRLMSQCSGYDIRELHDQCDSAAN